MLVISAGHTPRRWGATNGKLKEHFLAREYAEALWKALGDVPKYLLPWRMTLAEKLKLIKRLWPNAIALDIHLNSYHLPTAHGAELFYGAGDLRGFSVGRALLDTHCELTGLKSRGLKLAQQSARGSLGWTQRLDSGILLELCFMSNMDDLKKLQSLSVELWATKVAEVLLHSLPR